MLQPRWSFVPAACLLVLNAHAQTPVTPAPLPTTTNPRIPSAATATQPAAAAGSAAAPVATAPGAPMADADVEKKVLDSLKSNDPMLAPLPPATKVLKTWQQALGLIRAQSTTLRSSYTQVLAAQARSRQALSAALPTLVGNATLTHQLLPGTAQTYADPLNPGNTFTQELPPSTTWNAGLTLRVPVFAPQAWYDHGTAEDSIEVARLDIREIERKVVAAAADAIVTSITAERLAEVSRVALASALSTLDLNQRRARLGAASAVDVLRAEQEVSLSRAQVVTTSEAVQRSREALGLTLGTSEPWGISGDVRLDELTQEAKNTCQIASSVDVRPDVQAARARVTLAERQMGSTKRSYWPTVDATSNATYWSYERQTPNQEHVTWTVGGLLTWNIYDGGARYGTEDLARQEVELNRLRLTDAQRQARLEAQQSLRGVQVAESTLVVSRKTRDLAAESARLARLSFLHGSGTSFDLVDTAQKLRQADLDLAIKEFEVVRAKITALLALATCKI